MSELEEIPDYFKKKINSKYKGGGFGNYTKNNLSEIFADIDERLRDIEHKVNPTAKKILSNRSQQMLLLHHLGFLEKLNEFNISNRKKSKLLSILLNASPSNIEADLSVLYNPKSKLKTSSNYKVITAAFKQAGIKKLEEETQDTLDRLEIAEEK